VSSLYGSAFVEVSGLSETSGSTLSVAKICSELRETQKIVVMII
jgi:hypothetical protein